MTADRQQYVEPPRVGRHVASPQRPVSDAYQSVMVQLVKLVGFVVAAAVGLTLIVAIGYVFGDCLGACISVAAVATILTVMVRSG